MKTLLIAIVLCTSIPCFAGDTWKPGKAPLMTRWAKQVSPDSVLPEYPRPSLVRDKWVNLNGLWEFAPAAGQENPPFGKSLKEHILVPFPVESALSGIMKRHEQIWYRRTFDTPAMQKGDRLLIHFGAVDWQATVWMNGKKIDTHKGGYNAFTLDITPFLAKEGHQELIVHVFDPTDAGRQARGKQSLKPHRIFYTPTTGIWQTVWLEIVPKISIDRLVITPDLDHASVLIKPELRFHLPVCCEETAKRMSKRFSVDLEVLDGDKVVAKGTANPFETLSIKIPSVKTWSPDAPFLYDVKAVLKKKDKALDAVTSYFGMRKVSLGKDDKGKTRILLNNKFVFQYGLLDQGFWPGGLYTAPTDEALRYDIEATKDLGFNMIRKHVKVEPARWYFWCDKLGILVWQDMPNGAVHDKEDIPTDEGTKRAAEQFEMELTAMMHTLHNHPSIVVWVPFNEGWGQYHTGPITKMVKELDPSRLVDSASGWHDRGTGDIQDVHAYPGPDCPKPEEKRAIVLGEFGGLGLPVEGHTWLSKDNWGYKSYTTREELQNAYLDLLKKLTPMIEKGLSAAVYTQTTDVETEVNGLMTYDRDVLKMDAGVIQKAHRDLIE